MCRNAKLGDRFSWRVFDFLGPMFRGGPFQSGLPGGPHWGVGDMGRSVARLSVGEFLRMIGQFGEPVGTLRRPRGSTRLVG